MEEVEGYGEKKKLLPFSPSPSSSFSKTLATQATARLRTSKHHREPTQSAFITVWDFTVIVLYLPLASLGVLSTFWPFCLK